MRSARGFTLVELLIVVALIGILAGIALTVLNPVFFHKKARDARRIEDLTILYKAITIALSDGEVYLTPTDACTACDSASGSAEANGTGWVVYTIPTGKTGLSNYVPYLPRDPVNNGQNVYTYASDGNRFELNAVLELEENYVKMTTDNGSDPNVFEIGTLLNIL